MQILFTVSLMDLTEANHKWGLCYLHLRDVRADKLNPKQVYRVYWELELNLRIKLRMRVSSARPAPLSARLQLTRCGRLIS